MKFHLSPIPIEKNAVAILPHFEYFCSAPARFSPVIVEKRSGD